MGRGGQKTRRNPLAGQRGQSSGRRRGQASLQPRGRGGYGGNNQKQVPPMQMPNLPVAVPAPLRSSAGQKPTIVIQNVSVFTNLFS